MLSKIDIYRFRNIREAHLALTNANLLAGLNGSGKTSVLEAFHLLAYGKSFRGSGIDAVIQRGSDDLVVSAKFGDQVAGIQRVRNGQVSVRLNGESLERVSELSRLLPTHVIEPNSVLLVEGSPSERRKYLDFTMFHVEHDYLNKHRQFTDALKQRNALLKHPHGEVSNQKPYWDELYGNVAWALHETRVRLFEEVVYPHIKLCLERLLPEVPIDLQYESGCRGTKSYEEFRDALRRSADQEQRFKATQLGPHRADILFKHNEKLAKDYLSRGQKKLLTYGVRLAPTTMLQQQNKLVGQVLIDDMPSELDEHSVEKVCDLLGKIDGQVLLTAVDETNRQVEIIDEMLTPKMFHVEHGVVTEKE
jgi:DNA replication and repair protein RecF